MVGAEQNLPVLVVFQVFLWRRLWMPGYCAPCFNLLYTCNILFLWIDIRPAIEPVFADCTVDSVFIPVLLCLLLIMLHETYLCRFYKLLTKGMCEVIPMTVPRKVVVYTVCLILLINTVLFKLLCRDFDLSITHTNCKPFKFWYYVLHPFNYICLMAFFPGQPG